MTKRIQCVLLLVSVCTTLAQGETRIIAGRGLKAVPGKDWSASSSRGLPNITLLLDTASSVKWSAHQVYGDTLTWDATRTWVLTNSPAPDSSSWIATDFDVSKKLASGDTVRFLHGEDTVRFLHGTDTARFLHGADTARFLHGADTTSLSTRILARADCLSALYWADSTLANGFVTNYDLSLKQSTSAKGQADGYAGLGAAALVPTSQLGSGSPSSSTYLRGDQTWETPAGGSDPWTYRMMGSEGFKTEEDTAVDVPDLTFTPEVVTKYEFEATLMIQTANAACNPRVGLAWPAGMIDGVAAITESQGANVAPLFAFGNIEAPLLIATGGSLPSANKSWPVTISGVCSAGDPLGDVRIQLASSAQGVEVYIVDGSFLKYRAIP